MPVNINKYLDKEGLKKVWTKVANEFSERDEKISALESAQVLIPLNLTSNIDSIITSSTTTKYYKFIWTNNNTTYEPVGTVEVQKNLSKGDIWSICVENGQYVSMELLGNMKGADGAAGTNGADGFSPLVSSVPIEGGNKVTITDATGPKSFDVYNGTNGANGQNGTNGVDGKDADMILPADDMENYFFPHLNARNYNNMHVYLIWTGADETDFTYDDYDNSMISEWDYATPSAISQRVSKTIKLKTYHLYHIKMIPADYDVFKVYDKGSLKPIKGTDYFTAEEIQDIAQNAAQQVSVPTRISELINDTNYQTSTQVTEAINAAIGNTIGGAY